MWVDTNGNLYIGDCRAGDRAATEAEIAAWSSRSIVPNSVTMRQARLSLIDADLDELVEVALDAMTGRDGKKARAEWATASVVERDSPLIASLGASLSLTSDQIDALFVSAAAL